MTYSTDETWVDDAAGPLVRPYTVSNGRTKPSAKMDLLSMVRSTGAVTQNEIGMDHAQALDVCADPVSVAEVSAMLCLPAVVTKVLLSDLVECGALMLKERTEAPDAKDRDLLEAVLNGLQRRL